MCSGLLYVVQQRVQFVNVLKSGGYNNASASQCRID